MSGKENSSSEEKKVDDEKKQDDTNEVKHSAEDKSSDDIAEKGRKVPPKKRVSKVKETKKEPSKKTRVQKKEKDGDEGDDEEDNEADEEDSEDEGKVPLLDQPLELSGTRERKKVQRFTEIFKTEPASAVPIEIPDGKGDKLGNIPRINAVIQKYKAEQLKGLHKILFNRIGKVPLIKKNIKQFCGFDFDKNSEQFEKKKNFIAKHEVRVLKSMCSVLDLDKKGNREDIAKRITEFLVFPKDSGKPAPTPRPKRSSAVKANRKGYSESEDEETKPRRQRGKRIITKDDVGSESDKEKSPKSKKPKKKESESEKEKSENDDRDEDLANEAETHEILNESLKKRGTSSLSKKESKKPVVNNKTEKKAPSSKKAEKKTQKKKKQEDRNDSGKADNGSSSEDEPLAKKAKTPPSDDDLKAYVKEILEGANLEEITMKTVCKQVYAHYPDFDLSHRKDFIKQTVKSLIST